MMIKKKLPILCLLLAAWQACAYNYGEHKEIGDQAFLQFLNQQQDSSALFFSFLDLKQDDKDVYYLSSLSGTGIPIGYGMLNALSGDHEKNPLLLEEQLRNKQSVIQRIILLHQQYMAQGYTAAPDNKLTRIDLHYATLAAVNLSHFYEYNRTFEQQLRHFDKALIRQCQKPELVERVFKRLGKTNAINMYVTLHVLAMDLAEQGGRLAHEGDNSQTARLLYYALLFNAFADHFLEDAFSSGHLVVNRTFMASFTNNKTLHDFYSELGCTVINNRGEQWHAYGDGQFNATHHAWQKDSSLYQIRYPHYTDEAARIIKAVRLSLSDIRNAFYAAYRQPELPAFVSLIPDAPQARMSFLLQRLPSLQLVPIPYGSDPITVMQDTARITDEMKQAALPPAYRNFVRNRVANSLVLSTFSSIADVYARGVEVRLNAGNLNRKFTYNDRGGKKGTFDYWHGYTLSYGYAAFKTNREATLSYKAQIVKAGLRSHFDFWISNKKFVGMVSYLEAGVLWQEGKAAFVFAPSAGLQFASLLNINYYNMPIWLRLPLQYILPLKLRLGPLLATGHQPQYYSAVDLDIFF